MKTFKLFSMAALAIMMGACSSDDNVLEEQPAKQQGKIPFSATISGANVTRTVIEEGTGSDAGKLVVAWKGDEEIALVHNGKKDVVPVTTVNPDGSAVITGSIDATGSDGEAVVLVYPADAVKSVTSGTTFVPNTDAAFLAIGLAQDGTLGYIGTNGLDGREGSGTLKISGGTATLNGNVTMESKAAIWELNLTTDGSTPLAAKTVTLKVGTQPIAGGAYASGKSKYYLCVVPKTLTTLYGITPTAAFTIEASDGTNTYTYTKASQLSLSTGTFYQSTVTMTKLVVGRALTSAVVGDIVGSDGKAYAAADKDNLPSGVTAVAMVAYKGSATGETGYANGLALALKDADNGSTCLWSTSTSSTVHTYYTNDDSKFSSISEGGLQYNATHNTADYPAFKAAMANNGTTAPTNCSAWFLPTCYQLQLMIDACKNVLGTNNNFTDLRDAFTGVGGENMKSQPYWLATEYEAYYAWRYLFNTGGWSGGSKNFDFYVRSAIAF